jgi:transposase InsO family protein
VVDGNTLTIDPKKASGLHDWPRTLNTVKEVRSVLGVLGYQRPFIPNFANIARPLVHLTKKNQPFQWTVECRTALDNLINTVLSSPALQQPNLTKPFFLQVDASAYATGAILTQKDDRDKHQAVGFHSQTLNDAERNYDIHDREYLAVFRGLTYWRHLLLSSPHIITVMTDHKNLEYYRRPQNINRRIARYIGRLADYNFILVHIPGTTNKADALSRRSDYDDGSKDNQDVTVLPPHLFTRAMTLSSLDERAKACQLKNQTLLNRWAQTFSLKREGDLFWYGDRLVIVEDLPLRRGVISLYHDSTTAGHPGISNTTWAIARDYWWPNIKQTVTEYIKGCTLCQSRKNHPTKPKPPNFPITSDTFTLPFTSIAMDFIVKLPISNTYDTILTITDTFSKASIFIPCNETIDAVGTAKLYATHILPHYGLPSRIISDRDTRFTSKFFTELCQLLSINQNVSTAYHPQTDGQSERTNQRLEQYLRIFGDYHQNDWAQWLPLAQYTLNAWPNATTKKAPFELIMGHIPRVHQTTRSSLSPSVDTRLQHIAEVRKEAAEALRKAANIEIPSKFIPYCVGDRVWLEARNLNTTHPTAKLAPRRHGPFLVTSVISRTSYRLKLPAQWKVHNVFHASLLTPYKETALNGGKYQEPPPDLINGQPEWEVDQILGARKRRNQLQYLVRWKGFADAHDSWEPLTHISADHLIAQFYKTHPKAIRSTTYKNPTTNPVTIRRIIMSTPENTSSINSPPLTLEERITDPSSPPLLERISEPPSPIPLHERLGEQVNLTANEEYSTPPSHPNSSPRSIISDDTIDVREQWMTGGTPPFGYEYYDVSKPNHVRYGFDVPQEDGTRKTPHYINFHFDTTNRLHHYPQHTVSVRRHNQDGLDYGESLQAKLPDIPIHDILTVDDKDLVSLSTVNADAQAVDIALLALDDPGVSADVDRLRKLVDSRTDLQQQARVLERKQYDLRQRFTAVSGRLTTARVRTRLHPYLQGTATIPNPRTRAERAATAGVPIADVLNGVVALPPTWLEQPRLHDPDKATDIAQWIRFTKQGQHFRRCTPPPPTSNRTTVTLTTSEALYSCNQCGPGVHPPFKCPKCMYCGKTGHSHINCYYPHTRCHTVTTCQVPYAHKYAGIRTPCPYAHKHTFEHDDMFEDGGAYDDVDWEAEDRGD